MPLHPQVQALVDAAGPHSPQLHELAPAAARARASGLAALIGPGPDLARVDDVVIAGTIPARVYAPDDPRATVIWFHGGGWVICGLDTHDAMCRTLARAARSTVVSVAYRRAPEHRFPAALEDAWTALRWAADADAAALRWAADADAAAPLVVGGDSAGGNLAAVCALRARDRGGPALALQVLVYPVTDCDLTRASYRGEHPMLNRHTMAWFWDQYLPDRAARANPEASPLRARDLAGLPPAVVLTAEHDPLRDEGRAYARRLRDAGVPVTAHHYDDMAHPFFALVNVYERSAEAIERVAEQIRSAAGEPAGHVVERAVDGREDARAA
jgi:acetyl esterase